MQVGVSACCDVCTRMNSPKDVFCRSISVVTMEGWLFLQGRAIKVPIRGTAQLLHPSPFLLLCKGKCLAFVICERIGSHPHCPVSSPREAVWGSVPG